ncbi:REP-associated tyrosine transposase [Anianabacter salinae]|uniref:REP-associated tyrosine transposase n=1 Tax=Anianabacter salinae TaxID=2851023 RepID=UPI00225E6D1E|nr:transposase [Anianabacter salinae]MBV0911003.1 transposase [Anianabacter salinae]
MPRYLRPEPTPAPVFFTVCLARRGSTALVDHLDVLRNAVRVTLAARPCEILAWVVLPDHMHAIWRLPESDPNYSQRWGRVKARFSRDACRAGLVPPPPVGTANGGVNPALRRKGELGIWQPRFCEHHCQSERDLQTHLRYCWANPVKHGYCAKPSDWAASSIHRDIRRGLVEAEWSGEPDAGNFGEAA